MKQIIYFILLFPFLIIFTFCQKHYNHIPEGNWNMIVAENLDQAGDLYHAVEYLKLAEKEEDASVSAKKYLEQIEERKGKAEKCIQDAQYSIDTSYLTRYHFRDYFQMGVCHELLGSNELAMEKYNNP